MPSIKNNLDNAAEGIWSKYKLPIIVGAVMLIVGLATGIYIA
ncbi:hypothetical protein [Pseudodesulfovibrio karagichevae]|uniref:Uncharacterized protein n=1 Tax=Pseudodesulfovibrio karagichevae TaxID=3239305 RepID=A0ABV4K1B7_9BACT